MSFRNPQFFTLNFSLLTSASRNLLLLAMAWAVAGVTVWAGEKPATATCAEEPYFIFSKSGKEPGLPAYYNHDQIGGGLARALAFLGEPRLPVLAKNPTLMVYRFTLFPARGDYFCVRIQKEGRRFRLWASHFVPGVCRKLVEHKEQLLSEADSQKLDELIKTLDFFKLRSEDKPMYLDGHTWLVEGVEGGKYNVIEHSCVNDDAKKRGLMPLYEFCKFLIDKDGLKETPKNMGYEIFGQ
ncbi:MAG: hypothetical protein NTY01_07180 [Verrucomicrobia bacterium]|nr:hypothetical protein [Verrucomicrobiota bacterium]